MPSKKKSSSASASASEAGIVSRVKRAIGSDAQASKKVDEKHRRQVLAEALGEDKADRALAIEKKHGFTTYYMWPHKGLREAMGRV